MDSAKSMADVLFPQKMAGVDEIMRRYPRRPLGEGAMVTRLAPSPTGELHIGTLYAAFISYRLAGQSGGVFYVRLDDTDGKREVKGSGTRICAQMRYMGIAYTEGYAGGANEIGTYGPYVQSARAGIYRAFARTLVVRGLAYPCFCTPEELDTLRSRQRSEGADIGYHGEWAVHRDISAHDAEREIAAGRPYVIRLRSPGQRGRKVAFDDLFKGRVEMPENTHDIIIIKSDGLPTYHFAHAVDDALMHTTHVLRGDEWLSSYPVHRQLFEALGHSQPVYGHLATIMKKEGASKRKYSKRKDADGHVSYHIHQGVPPAAMREYYMHLMNSGYEDWRSAHPFAPLEDYCIRLDGFSASGAVFDYDKLTRISRDMIAQMTADDALDALMTWAKIEDPLLFALLAGDPLYARGVLSIGRGIKNPRKDIGKWSDVRARLGYFWDELFAGGGAEAGAHAAEHPFVLKYAQTLDLGNEKQEWYEGLKRSAQEMGYTADKKAFAADPTRYAGTLGDAAALVRLALTGQEDSPDLYDVMRVMGAERVARRLSAQSARS